MVFYHSNNQVVSNFWLWFLRVSILKSYCTSSKVFFCIYWAGHVFFILILFTDIILLVSLKQKHPGYGIFLLNVEERAEE